MWVSLGLVGLLIAVTSVGGGARLLARTSLSHDSISLSADWLQEWEQGREHIGLFRGNCVVKQGPTTWKGDKMVVWVESADIDSHTVEDRLTIWLEGNVQEISDSGHRTDSTKLLKLTTTSGVDLSVRGRISDSPAPRDAFYLRGLKQRQAGSPESMLARSELLQTQLTVDPPPLVLPPGGSTFNVSPQADMFPGQAPPGQISPGQFSPGQISPGVGTPPPAAMRRVRVFPRSALPFDVRSFRNENTLPPEQVVQLTGGVTIIVDGVERVGVVDLSADNAVIWTTALGNGEFSTESLQTGDTPYQVYLEGNIIIRQGENVVRASRAFYDAREDRALILDAELKSLLPDQHGLTVRVRAESIRQLSRDTFQARNAYVTTSQLGEPVYRIQSSDIFVDQRTWSPWSQPTVDPQTGMLKNDTTTWITAQNNTFVFGSVPLLYAPVISGPAEDPNIPIQSLTFSQDSIFGSQFRSRWDAFQLFGLQKPADTRWTLEADYLSDRGPFLATDGTYRGVDGYGNSFFGNGLAAYVNDHGLDNLGLGRRDLTFPNDNRGIIDARHRHQLLNGIEIQAEAGWASDRNFREQYYEQQFDTGKDLEMYLGMTQRYDQLAWSIWGRPSVNDFEYTTQWLPRGDLYVLGTPLLSNLLSYSSHTSAGYAQLDNAAPPPDPNDLFTPLPYYTDASGLVAMTRHSVEMPFQLGQFNFTPYAMGEAAFWSDSFNNDSIDRFYGRAGLRGSVQMWKVYPYVQSDLYNLNGLAHRMVLGADYGYAASSRSLSEIPQWNEFDDNSQERFRERLVVNTFGGTLPNVFEPRNYAVRSGAGTGVTDPYHELVDDQQMLALNWSHRLQTKVGPPERLRIKDWMTLDLGVNYYPDSARDNFGESFGLFSARYAWYVGDRTSLHASTLLDFFDDGQKIFNLGVLTQRSVRGSAYVGFRQVDGGALLSQILTASYSYQMSPKWISTAGTAYDVGEGQNRGQSLTITRVGESFLVHVGASYDASKNNPGVAISIEPKLGNRKTSPTMISPLMGAGF
ncbi:MAG: hypothetical protein C0478_03380 [Planctomyces sp.]|nr:hypothetical protein [Planctomyces sp.]